MPSKPPVHRLPGTGDRKQRHHPRSAEAEAYRKLYRDKRWSGPHGVKQQALLRDLYTCQRCNSLLVTGNRHHPRAAVVNHKKPHKGDETLFFDLETTEAVCKSCHDALIQREEARGNTPTKVTA